MGPRAAANRPAFVASSFRFSDTEPGKTQWVRFDHGGNMPETTRHEMMLNTDLCLMYANPQGKPVMATNDDCCTWTPPEMVSLSEEFWLCWATGACVWRRWNMPAHLHRRLYLRFEQIMRNSGGAYCGTSVNERQSTANHKACCHNTEWETCAKDKVKNFGGPAEKDILEFAADEETWHKAFLISWKKATENGHGSLRRLGTCQR